MANNLTPASTIPPGATPGTDNTTKTDTVVATLNPYVSLFSGVAQTGGNLWLASLQNKGKEIDGSYSVERQRMLNNAALTESQRQQALGQLNIAYEGAKADATAKRQRSLLTLAGVLLVIGGIITLAIILAVRAIPRQSRLPRNDSRR